MQKRVHSKEFKLDIVRQVATGQKRPAQACREYGLADSVLSRWRKEYEEKQHFNLSSQKERQHRSIELLNSNSSVGNLP